MVTREVRRNDIIRVTTKFPLTSWQRCELCRKEYVREKMWFFWVPCSYEGYICMKCALTKEEAVHIANTKKWDIGTLSLRAM